MAVADRQTAGRGRLGRSWVAPPGGSLLVSVLLRPALPLEHWHLVTMTAGLAAAEAVRRLTDGAVAPRLKWPNDLVVQGGKLAGILAERADDALVVGMGLNVDWPAVPDELVGIATAISLESRELRGSRGLPSVFAVPDRDSVLAAWLSRWHGWLTIVEAPDGPRRAHAALVAASATIGSDVRVELAGETFVGRATTITDLGHLRVDTGAGIRDVSAGDVVHLRPQ